AALRLSLPNKIDEQARRLAQKNDALHKGGISAAKQTLEEKISRYREEAANQALRFVEAHNTKMTALKIERDTQWQALEADWKNVITPLYAKIADAGAAAEETFPAWDRPGWDQWTPPDEFKNAVKFAQLEVDLEVFA